MQKGQQQELHQQHWFNWALNKQQREVQRLQDDICTAMALPQLVGAGLNGLSQLTEC